MSRPKRLFKERVKKIHFIGVGGIGMSGIAEILIDLGYEVSGSDLRKNDNTQRLENKGAVVFEGHNGDYVSNVDVVVKSSAVRDENPEIIMARGKKIPVIPRAEMLAELMRFSDGIAVAGTHGKTTSTSMMAEILHKGGTDATVIIGGKLNSMGSNAKTGTGKMMLVEADESDRSFLFLRPLVNIVTNIDIEHMENYSDLDDLKDSFGKFMSSVPFYGFNVVCADNEMLMEVAMSVHRRIITYGQTENAAYRAVNIHTSGLYSTYNVLKDGEEKGEITINIPGRHNVMNSLGCVSCALELGIPFDIIREALGSFEGVDRRFTIKGEKNNILVVDDYGHHPTEIVATLDAARQGYPERRIIAVFQPHRYSRVVSLFREFAGAFYNADHVFVTEIYGAGESPRENINARKIADAISRNSHRKSEPSGDLSSTLDLLKKTVRPGDLVITLGAGSITGLGKMLLEEL
ncbi:MAG: UDP-N-acetylmuramate--L-alanine ligase [Deltaproteobacteria bacterium]|nr:UDP-N-acetylmuramate--L-alanine ligase [Deltaproteobacteria bacterium]